MEMKQLGVGLATAFLLDAIIIRAVVLRSVMSLLGQGYWWAPRFIRDRTPDPVAAAAVGADAIAVPQLVAAEHH